MHRIESMAHLKTTAEPLDEPTEVAEFDIAFDVAGFPFPANPPESLMAAEQPIDRPSARLRQVRR